MILVSFQVDNKFGRVQFFQKTFLLANTSIDVVLSSTNDQAGTDYRLEKICGSSSKANQKSFHGLLGLS